MEEVGYPTKEKTGGTASRADAGVTDRTDPTNMSIAIAATRVTGAEATASGTEDRTEATVGMGVRGFKGTLSTPPILKKDSGSSSETRPIVT